jgi:hypothetical protein
MIVNLFKSKKPRVFGPRVSCWLISSEPPIKSYSRSFIVILLKKGAMKHGIAEQTRLR